MIIVDFVGLSTPLSSRYGLLEWAEFDRNWIENVSNCAKIVKKLVKIYRNCIKMNRKCLNMTRIGPKMTRLCPNMTKICPKSKWNDLYMNWNSWKMIKKRWLKKSNDNCGAAGLSTPLSSRHKMSIGSWMRVMYCESWIFQTRTTIFVRGFRIFYLANLHTIFTSSHYVHICILVDKTAFFCQNVVGFA